MIGPWPFAAPDGGAGESDLDVARGLEADLLDVDPRGVRVGVAFEAADEELVTEGAGEAREQRDVKRLRAIDLEGVDVLGVVAVKKLPPLGRGQPVVALADGELVVEQTIGEVRLDSADRLAAEIGPSGIVDWTGLVAMGTTSIAESVIEQSGRVPGSRGGELVLCRERRG